jgi:hypothetical protein
MQAGEDSFLGTWKGRHENGLSIMTVDLKRENGKVFGVWIVEAPLGGKIISAMEVAITEPRIEGNRISFKPNPDGPGVMALELVGENEAVFGPIIIQSDVDRYFDQMANEIKERFEVTVERSQLDPDSPEVIRGIQSHQVKLIRQESVGQPSSGEHR